MDEIGTAWGTFTAAVQKMDDVFDIYLRQSGILDWHLDREDTFDGDWENEGEPDAEGWNSGPPETPDGEEDLE